MQVSKIKKKKLPFTVNGKWGGGLLISTHRSMYLVSPCGKCLIHTLTGGVFLSADFICQLFMLTCFFFCASLLSTAGVETSKDFCAAFRAAGLYTVLVRPVDVDNTYQHKFNFFRVLLFIIY